MTAKPCHHGCGRPQLARLARSPSLPAVIVIGREDRESRLQVAQFLGETVGQPVQSLEHQPWRELGVFAAIVKLESRSGQSANTRIAAILDAKPARILRPDRLFWEEVTVQPTLKESMYLPVDHDFLRTILLM